MLFRSLIVEGGEATAFKKAPGIVGTGGKVVCALKAQHIHQQGGQQRGARTVAASNQHVGLSSNRLKAKPLAPFLAPRFWQRPHWLGGDGHKPDQLVSFLICGAQKAGTTALADYLRGHPQLFLPEQKELHHFDDETLVWGEIGRAHV